MIRFALIASNKAEIVEAMVEFIRVISSKAFTAGRRGVCVREGRRYWP